MTSTPFGASSSLARQEAAPGALTALAAKGWIAGGAVCVTELAAREGFEAPAGFDVLEERTYGAARVVFLRRAG